MLDNELEDKEYVGRASIVNSLFVAVNIGEYFVYDKYNHLSNWVGYQVAQKTTNDNFIHVYNPFAKLRDSISYCRICNKMKDI